MNHPDDLDIAQLKIPPYSIEAEQAVIGGLMIANDSWDTVSEILNEKDFFRPEHRKIFAAMISLVERQQPIDIITITTQFESNHREEEVGGFAYLAQIARSTPAASNVRAYAIAVKKFSRARALIVLGQNISELGWNEEISIEEREELAQAGLMQLGDNDGDDIVSTNQALKELVDEIDRRYNQGAEITGLTTGFFDIDKRTHGLQPQDLIVIAGRPAMGKTTLAMNIVEHVAFQLRQSVLVFSMEMSRSQLFERMIASVGKIKLQSIQNGQFEYDEWPKMSHAISHMKDSALIVDDRPSLTIAQMRSRARKMHKKNPLALIVVDYLQLAVGKNSKNDNREQEVSSISRGLKSIAKEINCPLIAIAQLNRQAENRTNNRPKTSDLRDSGAIEQDADLICMLYRDEVYNEDSTEKGIAELIWTKFRNGETGKDFLATRLDQSRFLHLESQYRPKENVTPINKKGFFDYE